MTTTVDTMQLARAERADLVELLAGLTDQQWNAPTLCHRWRVREVVAHIFSYDDLSMPALIARFLRSGLAPDRANDLGVAAAAQLSNAELLDLAKAHIQPGGLPATFDGQIALTDGLIHHQDIRRPLRLPRDIPTDRLRAALDFGKTARPLGSAQRIKGLTLTATDLDWTTGTGPLVEGTAQALLLGMAGRRSAIDELAGPGQSTLAERAGP
jgi:uncharacterized protein (TIGR03083 family)